MFCKQYLVFATCYLRLRKPCVILKYVFILLLWHLPLLQVILPVSSMKDFIQLTNTKYETTNLRRIICGSHKYIIFLFGIRIRSTSAQRLQRDNCFNRQPNRAVKVKSVLRKECLHRERNMHAKYLVKSSGMYGDLLMSECGSLILYVHKYNINNNRK